MQRKLALRVTSLFVSLHLLVLVTGCATKEASPTPSAAPEAGQPAAAGKGAPGYAQPGAAAETQAPGSNPYSTR